MKQKIIYWLLKWLGAPVDALPVLPVYVIVEPGHRIADVTTNYNRARAIVKEKRANRLSVELYRYQAIKKESIE